MTGPAPTARTRSMVEDYELGATLAEVGEIYGVSKQRVAAILKRHAPSYRPEPRVAYRGVGEWDHR